MLKKSKCGSFIEGFVKQITVNWKNGILLSHSKDDVGVDLLTLRGINDTLSEKPKNFKTVIIMW